MNILVTGGCGGIGTSLIPILQSLGHYVVIIDNLRNGYSDNLKNFDTDKYIFYNQDICDENSVMDIMLNHNVNVVIHLAAITSLMDCELNKVECLTTNVIGTQVLLECSKKLGIKKFIFASTSAVYENTPIEMSPFSENSIVSPRLFYSTSKLMSENLVLSYIENYSLNAVILRFFNVISHNQDFFRKSPPILNYLVRCHIRNETPILHSDGEQRRDYISIDDIVNFIKIIIDSNTNDKIFNLCSSKLYSVNELVKLINEEFSIELNPTYRSSDLLWGSESPLFNNPNPLKREIITKETNKFSLGDNSLAKTLGWSPNQDMDSIIKKTARKIFEQHKPIY